MRRSRRRSAPIGAAVALATALLSLLSVVSLVLFAPPADAATTVNVQVGFGGRHRTGADLLVQVDIVADQLIDGELRIRPEDGPGGLTVVVPVEVAGGAQKRFVAVMPGVLLWTNSITVSVYDGAGSTPIATQRAQIVPDQDELVGVLPSLADTAPATAELAVDLGQARIFPIDDSLLAVGPGAIDALGTIVASSGDLAALTEPARGSLQTWVGSGGTLVVDDAPGPIPGFDVPAAETPTSVGLGRIIATDGALGGGDWDGALLPTPYVQDPAGDGSLTGEITGEVAWFGSPLANSLAQDAGFGLPPIGIVLPLMGAYVLVIGPLAWFVLRRLGRSGMMWIALPALAVACTAVIWAAGGRIRSGAELAHGTVIRIENGVASAYSNVLNSSAGGSTAALDLPADWRPLQTEDFRFGFDAGARTVVRPGLGGTRVEATLDAGDFALLGGEGPAPQFIDALEVTAESAATGITTGTVTNRLDVALEQVAVFVGAQATNIGTLEPGASLSFTVDDDEADARFGQPVEMRVWQSDFNEFTGIPHDTGPVNLSLWAGYAVSNIGRIRQPGTVSVVGWTEALPSPLDPTAIAGRTAVLARATVEPTGNALSDVAGERTLLRGAEQAGFRPDQFRFTVTTAWRLDVPAGIDSAELALQLPRALAAVDVWDGAAWRSLEDPAPGLYALPPDAFIAGALYVRPSVDFDQQSLLGKEFSLVSVDAGTELVDALAVADALAEEDAS